MNSILTVTGAASSYDLTVLETVKAELDSSDDTEDEKLERWITQASAIVAEHCNRVFALETVSEQFRLRSCERREALTLSRYPVGDVTSVTEDDTALTDADWEVDPESGILVRLSGGGTTCWSARKIVVVYSGGYELLDGLPNSIERATIELVKLYRANAGRDPLVKSESLPGVISQEYWIGSIGENGALPPNVLDLLKPFRRFIVA